MAVTRKKFAAYSGPVIRSARWPALRLQALRRDGWRCVQCGGRGRLEVDHVKPVRTHPALGFTLENLQSLCAACHTRKTRIECGHAPLDPARAAWREFVAALAKPKHKGTINA
jgi:5-methylcytosine-specific restriction endonuclease McrA